MRGLCTALWPGEPVAPPHQGGPGVRQRHRVRKGAPTEITGAPTTPLPATRAKTPPKRSRAGLVIGVVIVAAGVGGDLSLHPGADHSLLSSVHNGRVLVPIRRTTPASAPLSYTLQPMWTCTTY